VPLAAPLDARRGLLAGLIDHAPMFPPEELPLAEALSAHEAALHSEPGWIVNRFVVRASLLPDLPPDFPHRLSVVVDETGGLELPMNDPRTEAFELPPHISFGVNGEALEFEVYGELAPGSPLEPIAELNQRAKIRCGGEHIPTVEELAAFIADCRRLHVPFKATAGLHHAVRTGEQHGFLNLLAAAQFGDEEQALAETDPSAFSLDEEAFRWRDHSADPEQVATMRRERFVSFGSCSFDEPVDELRALGFL
jgi:hypothetical protein